MNKQSLQNQSDKVNREIRSENYFKQFSDHDGRFSKIKFKHLRLTHERLQSLLHYDPLTGLFTWRESGKNPHPFRPEGFEKCDGHFITQVDSKIYKDSNLAYFYMTGHMPDGKIIHKNGFNRDDRWENLKHIPKPGSELKWEDIEDIL